MKEKKSFFLKKISKRYDKVQVLKEIDLKIDEGEFVVLVGPSGCGKSTLLNIVSGLEPNFSGEIFFDGKDITKSSPKERDVAMVFQSYALYPNMSVRENIGFGLKNRKKSQDKSIDEIVKEVAESLQIGELLDRKPAQLSGGQRQRVAMGRAISRNPKLFLFDEPLSNLDANLRVDMRQEIKLFHKKLKTAVVYVTHDQTEAMTLADKIAVLRDGLIEQVGSPQEVYHQPNNIFVASFIGLPSINLIPVTLEKAGQDHFITLKNSDLKKFKFKIKASKSLAKYSQQEIILGIRPENLEKMTDGKTFFKKEKVIEAKIDFSENTGPDNHIFIMLNNQKVIVRSLTPLSSKESRIKVNCLLSKAIFFDKKTGLRI